MRKSTVYTSISMKKTKLHSSEHGLIAIFSVMVIMGILTLLAIGFSKVVLQAQYRTLNDQLNTQAFYAAESGINDALRALSANSADITLAQKDTCATGGNYAYNYMIDAALGIEYTCVLVDVDPPSITFSDVPVAGASDPTVTLLEPADGSDITEVNFAWDSQDSSDPIPSFSFNGGGSPELPTAAAWGNSIGVLRVDLVPLSAVRSVTNSRRDMVDLTYSFLVYPTDDPAIAINNLIGGGRGHTNQGGTLMTRCQASVLPGDYRCRATVDLNPDVVGPLYMRVQSYYNPVRTEFTVTGVDELVGGQILIDVTGKANGVFRRLQVSVPAVPGASYLGGIHNPYALLTADSLCKRLIAAPQSGGVGGSTVVGGGGDAACDIN
jgi:hypothetical protein